MDRSFPFHDTLDGEKASLAGGGARKRSRTDFHTTMLQTPVSSSKVMNTTPDAVFGSLAAGDNASHMDELFVSIAREFTRLAATVEFRFIAYQRHGGADPR